MELSIGPLSVAETAFHLITANYLPGSLQTDLSLSANCRTTTEASYGIYGGTEVPMQWRTNDRMLGPLYFHLKDQKNFLFFSKYFCK